jgi:hypothetical protein
MNPSVIEGMLAGAGLIGAGATASWAVMRLRRPGLCSCGHSWGCLDKFTGHCTATVVQANWVGGVRKTRKRAPCPCMEHRQQAIVRAITEVAP